MSRPAFTVLELLACIGVVALLLTLALPAVQAAREQSRAVACVNNQKQVTLTLLELCGSSQQESPTSVSFVADVSERLDLPIPNRIGFVRGSGTRLNNGDRWETPALWQCPSTTYFSPERGNTSYWINGGDALQGPDHGVITPGSREIGTDQIVDGRSQTALLGERQPNLSSLPVSFRTPAPFPPEHILFYRRIGTIPGFGATFHNEFNRRCTSSTAPLGGRSGQVSIEGQGHRNGYDHLSPPNAYSCLPVDATSQLGSTTQQNLPSYQNLPANSEHNGFVTISFADGSSRKITDSIDRQTWQALGTSRTRDVVPTF